MVFPGSTLFNKGAPWIVAAEMVKTSRLFARTVAKIDPAWLEELGGDLCRSTYSHPHWEKSRGEVRALEQVTLFGLVIVSGRSVSFGGIDPEQAHRIFLQSALVEGDVKESLYFLRYNKGLFQKVQEVEEKIRRRGILVSEEAVADFYSRRLQGISDIRSLKKMIRKRGGDDFLKMKESDLLLERPGDEELSLFPNQVGFGNRLFDCSYRFAPGREEDGVTVSVPSGLLALISAEKLEWSVPGLYREKITALVKGLPKRYRKLLVPVSNTVDIIEKEMEQGNGSLLSALAAFVFDRFGVDIPASVWAGVEIPEYLKIRISVVDPQGHELEAGRDAHLLSRTIPEVEPVGTNHAWKRTQEKWEREGITGWDFGDLPESVPVGPSTAAYPGLEPGERWVNIRLFASPQKALVSHQEGIRQLFMLYFSRDLRFLKQDLSLKGVQCPGAAYFGGASAVKKALYECLLRMLFQKNIRTREAFLEQAQAVRSSLWAKARELRDQVVKVLDAYHETRSTLHRVENVGRENKAVLELCTLVREELQTLVPEDFLEIYSLERLAHVPRYLKALEMRVERGAYDPLKDQKRAAEAAAFSEDADKLNRDAVTSGSSTEKKEALQELRWMIEEFKVSLFAQELKTAFPVSPKRLRKKIDEIKRMV
jgi:ATP-dependent helicase HrpA